MSKKKYISVIICVMLILSISIGVSIAGSNREYPLNNYSVLSTAEVYLPPHLTYTYVDNDSTNPYRQYSYNLPNKVVGQNQGCAVVSFAIGVSILSKSTANPFDYFDDPQNIKCKWIDPAYSATEKYTYSNYSETYIKQKMYDSIKAGNPVVYYICKSSTNIDSGHYVLVNGYKDSARRDSLNYSDFICIDPYSGEITYLSSANTWSKRVQKNCNIRIVKKR